MNAYTTATRAYELSPTEANWAEVLKTVDAKIAAEDLAEKRYPGNAKKAGDRRFTAERLTAMGDLT